MKLKCLTLFIILWATIGHSSVVILDNSTLPSSQGWQYSTSGIHSGVLETNIFSVNGGVLTMDNMAEPANWSGGSVFYHLDNIVEPAMATVLEWTSRTTEYEKAISGGYDNGFMVDLADGQYRFRAGITKETLWVNIGAADEQTIAIDGTQYHTYRIETVTRAPEYDFYVDNVLQASFTGLSSSDNFLRFGDSTSTANARVDISAMQFYQIPEPATASMFLLIFPMLLIRRNLMPGKERKAGRLYLHLTKLNQYLCLGLRNRSLKADRW